MRRRASAPRAAADYDTSCAALAGVRAPKLGWVGGPITLPCAKVAPLALTHCSSSAVQLTGIGFVEGAHIFSVDVRENAANGHHQVAHRLLREVEHSENINGWPVGHPLCQLHVQFARLWHNTRRRRRAGDRVE